MAPTGSDSFGTFQYYPEDFMLAWAVNGDNYSEITLVRAGDKL
jgi:hypothetical protein